MDEFYEYEQEFYEEPDYEQFERRMIDLDRDLGEYDLDYEVIPVCDLCGEEDDGLGDDWNGETGNHYSCEKQG